MDDPVALDVRLVERMIEKGRLDRKEYEKYLESLPDTSSKAENAEASLRDWGAAVEKKKPAKKKKG